MAEENFSQQSLLSKKIAANKAAEEASTQAIVDHSEKILNLAQLHGNTITKSGKTVGQMKRDLEEIIALEKDRVDEAKTNNKILGDNKLEIEATLDVADKIGKKIKDSVESIPFIGDKLSEVLNLDDLSENLQKQTLDSLDKAFDAQKGEKSFAKALGNPIKRIEKGIMNNIISPLNKMGPTGKAAARGIFGAMKFAMNPVTLGIAAGIAGFTAIFKIVTSIRKANRDLANDLGIQTSEARKFQIPLKASEKAFNMMGLDGSKLKTTMASIGQEFGSLENMTVSNARNIERFAQNSGIAGSEIVKFNKVMMDLTGSSFDVATNMAKTAADMARSANVSTAKVLSDIASNAQKFAEFSMSGAQGLAEAAVEAAKVGASLESILSAADSLIDFESAITAQFKAQVLTGKQINTERARQLALDGDIAGLTNEIQSIVGSVGDIQTLNVIQRKSVADAIGISVADLIRISRGEQAQQQETVQDKLDITNRLLSTQSDEAAEFYATQQGTRKVELAQPTFS